MDAAVAGVVDDGDSDGASHAKTSKPKKAKQQKKKQGETKQGGCKEKESVQRGSPHPHQ